MAEEPRRRLIVPPNLEGGIYSNQFLVWHSFHEFTLDFSVDRPMRPVVDDDEEDAAIVTRVVSRVRLPVTMVFEGIRRLNAEMTRCEQSFGEIPRPADAGDER